MSELYTIKELANRFKVTEQTIFNWIRNKGLPIIKIGRSTRIKEHELNEWLKSQQKKVK